MPTHHPDQEGPGPRRSPELVERLERARQRGQQRREQARERHKVVAEAVKRYLTAWHAISVHERQRDTDIEALRARITELQARTSEEISRHRVEQAAAALLIREQGHADDEIADMLEISRRQLRTLLTHTRTTPTTPTPPTETTSDRVSAEPAIPRPNPEASGQHTQTEPEI